VENAVVEMEKRRRGGEVKDEENERTYNKNKFFTFPKQNS
jgi:hypothetical protein